MKAWRRTKHSIRRKEAALRLLSDLPAGRKVLDAPCGAGELACALWERGHRVWASDLSLEVFPGSEGIRFDAADLNHSLPYADNFFDAVISLEGIDHIERPASCLE